MQLDTLTPEPTKPEPLAELTVRAHVFAPGDDPSVQPRLGDEIGWRDTLRKRYFWWIGHSAMAAIAVVQLGFAITRSPNDFRPLISGITKGMDG